MPVAAYGGRREIMQLISPEGPVYQAGTFSGHSVGMATGLSTLQYLQSHPELYEQLEATTLALTEGLRKQAKAAAIPHVIQRVGSMFTLFFYEGESVRNFSEAKRSNTKMYARFFHEMLKRGVYFPPSQLETVFVSTAIDEARVEETLKASAAAFLRL